MVENRYALIIANNQYNDERLHDLVTPPINAEELKKVLEDTDIANFKIKLLLNETVSIILNEIDELFSEKERNDLLLLYFVGHGVRDDKGRLYLAVNKTNCKRLPGTAIESRFIVDRMDDSYSQKKVLILDCCNSGAFDNRMMAVPTSMGTSVAFEGNGTGRYVMTATDKVQFSWEGIQRTGKAEPSVFTKYLIKGLKGEAVDDKGNITFDSLYDYVHDAVVKEKPEQRPQKSVRGAGNLVIAIGRPKPARLPPELVDAIGSPFTKTRLDAVYELGRLLRSSNKSLALEAEKSLKFLSDEDDSRMVSKVATEILDTHKRERGYIGEVVEKDSSNNPKVIEGVEQTVKTEAEQEIEAGRPEAPPDSEISTIVEKSKNEVRPEEQEAQLAELYAQAVKAKKAQNWEQVISICQKMRTIDPGYKDAATLLSNAKYEVYSLEEKRKAEEAEKRRTEEWETFLMQEAEKRRNEGFEEVVKPEAEQEIEAEQPEAPPDSEISTINDLNKEARGFLKKGNFEYAIAKWEEVLKLERGNREAIDGIKESNRIFESRKTLDYSPYEGELWTFWKRKTSRSGV